VTEVVEPEPFEAGGPDGRRQTVAQNELRRIGRPVGDGNTRPLSCTTGTANCSSSIETRKPGNAMVRPRLRLRRERSGSQPAVRLAVARPSPATRRLTDRTHGRPPSPRLQCNGGPQRSSAVSLPRGCDNLLRIYRDIRIG
jgi:hypothetical protein